MSTLPVAILLGATVGMGVILATLYWRGRRKPVLIGVHFLLAAGSLEALAMVLHGTPDGRSGSHDRLGVVAGALVVTALFAALTSSLLGAQQPKAARVMLVTHATAGSTALIVFLVWMTTL